MPGRVPSCRGQRRAIASRYQKVGMETTIATRVPAISANDHHNEVASVMPSSGMQKLCPFIKHSECEPIRSAPLASADRGLTHDKICHPQSDIR